MKRTRRCWAGILIVGAVIAGRSAAWAEDEAFTMTMQLAILQPAR